MIIFLYGLDTFRSRQKLRQIKQKFINEVDKSNLNVEILNGEKLDPARFKEAISTQPFLAKKRLVIIEDLISKNKGQKLQKEILETLNDKPLKETVLVFWESAAEGSKAKKSKLTKQRTDNLLSKLKKEEFAQEFKLLTPAQTQKYITNEIKAKGGEIEPAATTLLATQVGDDTWQLKNELLKLLAFRDSKKISVDDIKSLVQSKIDDDIFKLTDALSQKNKALALKLISDQIKDGTSPIELLSKITWQFKNLLIVKNFTEENGSGYAPDKMGYQLGLHPFVVKKTMAQVKSHDLQSLKSNYRHLLHIDRKLKTSQVDPEVLFDLFVVKN